MPRALQATLYSRSYCHLCDDLLTALAPWCERGLVEVTVVDVDADAALEERFGERVPVLTWQGGEICYGALSEDRLREVLSLVG